MDDRVGEAFDAQDRQDALDRKMVEAIRFEQSQPRTSAAFRNFVGIATCLFFVWAFWHRLTEH